MPDATDKRFIVKVSVVTAVLLVLVVAGALGWRPVLIAYHNRKADVANPWADPRDPNADHAVYEWHLGRLVQLGHLGTRLYYLDHISDARGEFVPFVRLLCAEFPSIRHEQPVVSVHPCELFIWAGASDLPAIDDFVEAHDVPDFMERFGREAEEARKQLLRRKPTP